MTEFFRGFCLAGIRKVVEDELTLFIVKCCWYMDSIEGQMILTENGNV
jgi:hypothetical protein